MAVGGSVKLVCPVCKGKSHFLLRRLLRRIWGAWWSEGRQGCFILSCCDRPGNRNGDARLMPMWRGGQSVLRACASIHSSTRLSCSSAPGSLASKLSGIDGRLVIASRPRDTPGISH